jgi:hypothetical protein
VVAGSALLILAIFLSDIPTMIMSRGWPTTGGIIVTSRLVGTSVREWSGNYYKEEHAYIRYRYAVDGTAYSSSAVNSINLPFSWYPRRYASRYPVGTQVSVYFNQKDPVKAVLEPGFVDVWKAFDVFSYLCFAAGIYFIFRGVSGRSYRNWSPMKG